MMQGSWAKEAACALAQSGGEERPCAVEQEARRTGKKWGDGEKSGDGIQSELGKLGSAWSAPVHGMHSSFIGGHICAISCDPHSLY